MARTAMFAGLVFDQEENALDVTWVGENACYVVYEDDFKRHVDAAAVDRQVLRFMREQVEGNRDMAVSAMLEMMGRDDLFTKVAVESTIDNMEQAVGQPIPEDARQWLGMLGFKIVIDEQGTVLDIQMPAGGIDEGDGE
ncbi:MAG: hypothetical protein M9936_11900 [Caldilinea sp.]|nr:hypothetical protein [Caldilinea sp.]MCB0059654.1 hypothetical protein [Caldilineaceae bacterium]MCB0147169.1 hypothetical protein [Caldilineaceae bacterium]MCB9117369.1 hypothetical protein [Caldilineaceae bacterium]MCB9121270.1 hypothetical protein [Caldilineaceae bacterium]